MEWIKWAMGLIGHIGLWCVVFNRIHATAWPRSSRKITEKAVLLAVALPFVWIASLLLLKRSLGFDTLTNFPLTFFYFYSCMLLGVFFICRWIWRQFSFPLPKAVIETKTEWIDVESECEVPLLHGVLPQALGMVPFNEVLKLTRQRMTFELDIPESLDGLKICQLSDTHYTGHLGIEYFQRVIEEANRFEPDLTFITGDLLDKPKCLDWLEPTFGQLEANLGVYYVLGNHDRRIPDEQELRTKIRKTGLIQASGQWHEMTFRGAKIQITGNELPWYRDVDQLADPPAPTPDLRILLSHSPDQVDWALTRNFDLMFAGHTHGGQIALPFFGPLVSPSKYGVLYAAGTFQISKMLMHVSRGISGDEPIRICSPPELGLFTIRSRGR